MIDDCCLPNTKYFDFQLEIKPFMRQMLTSWMLEVVLVSLMISRTQL